MPSPFTPTDEQLSAKAALLAGKSFAIEAGAGTGKTSTIRFLGGLVPERRVLYIAFNRKIVDEAAATMPSNVHARTAHALAKRAIGNNYAQRLDQRERVLSREVAKQLGIEGIGVYVNGERKFLSAGKLAGLVRETVTRFCQSADREPAEHHVPYVKGIDHPPGHMTNNREVRRHIIGYVRAAWKDLQRTDAQGGGKLKFDHEHYLKLYELSGPEIAADLIVCDEAQDLSPVMRSIVEQQEARGVQVVWVGDSCQPAGTLVQRIAKVGAGQRATVVEEVSIEQVEEGDLVVSYDIASGHLHRRGNRVLGVSERSFAGQLVQIDAGLTWVSSYTPGHHCVAKLGPAFAGKHLVYLMRRGASFRIGRAAAAYTSGFGPLARAKAEGADALWILSAHDTAAGAAAAEALASHNHRIPMMLFSAAQNRLASQDAIDGFWQAVGDLGENARGCLAEHGRALRFPLWSRGDGNLLMRRATRIRACNLMAGMHVPVIAAAQVEWAEAKINRLGPDACTVYSMTVENDHTYVGDGIVTHNCQQIYSFTGAVNALAQVQVETRTFLTQSFRFGPAVAEVANQVLAALDADLRIVGTPALESRVCTLAEPDAILCRTNAEAVTEMLKTIESGRKAHLVGKGAEVISFVKGAVQLMDEGWSSHFDLGCFKTWAEVQTYVEEDEQGGDLRLLVNLIDEFGAETILNALENMPKERDADVVICTAHKSKGLEWNRVRLAGDFPEQPKDEELRLLYVAVTRARLELDITAVPFLATLAPALAPVADRIDGLVPVTPATRAALEQLAPEATPIERPGLSADALEAAQGRAGELQTAPESEPVAEVIARSLARVMGESNAASMTREIMTELALAGLVAEREQAEVIA